MVQVGGLDIGSPDAMAIDGIRDTYNATGVSFEELDRDEIARRFPQFNLPQGTLGLYQEDYGLLAADRCVATLAAQARAAGAAIREGETVLAVTPDADGVEVRTSSTTFRASRAVLAAGSWIEPFTRTLGLDLPISVLKEQLAFFTAREHRQYVPGRLPLVIHRFPGTTSLGSVFPIFKHAGVKIMIDRIGPIVDPSDQDRSIDANSLEKLRAYAVDLLPGLTGEIIESVSCRFTMTPDEDFILDRHPEHPRIVIASACSGHGSKFAVAIGQILGDLAITGSTSYDIARFSLDWPSLKSLRNRTPGGC